MDKDHSLSDTIDHCFEDSEDCIEHVTRHVEDAVCYWEVMCQMLMPELTSETRRQLFYEMSRVCFEYYEEMLEVISPPPTEGPFRIQGTIPRF